MRTTWIKKWDKITLIAGWIFGIIGGFVFTPTLDIPDDSKSLWNLSRFVMTIIAGLVIVLANYLNKRKHLIIWVSLTLISLFIGLYALNLYDSKTRYCTCKYYSRRILIGSELRDYKRDHGKNSEDLIKSAAGEIRDIWTTDSIERCRKQVMYFYIGIIPVFTISLISMLQAWRLASKRKMKSPNLVSINSKA